MKNATVPIAEQSLDDFRIDALLRVRVKNRRLAVKNQSTTVLDCLTSTRECNRATAKRHAFQTASERNRPRLYRRRPGTELPELDLAGFAVNPASGDEGLVVARETD